jgi:hypothetical protein
LPPLAVIMRHVPSPKPEAPPVTTNTRPGIFMVGLFFSCSKGLVYVAGGEKIVASVCVSFEWCLQVFRPQKDIISLAPHA